MIRLVIMAKRKNRKPKAKLPPRTKKITPTFKQRIAFNVLSDIIRNPQGRKSISMGKVLAKAGYSTEMQKKPKLVTQSKGWLQLMEEKFPDKLISERMGEQLDAQAIEHYIFSSKTPDEEIYDTIEQFGFKVMKISKTGTWKRAYYSAPDHNSRDKMIEKLLKLKRKYPAEKHEHAVAVVKIVKYV